jgi:hypothetical protein
MPKATFEMLDGDEIEIDSDDVVHMSAGEEEETTVIELENGEEVSVVATQIEVAAELGLNPLDYIDPEDDDESLEALVEDDSDELDES